jgi:hypothetical protein
MHVLVLMRGISVVACISSTQGQSDRKTSRRGNLHKRRKQDGNTRCNRSNVARFATTGNGESSSLFATFAIFGHALEPRRWKVPRQK